MIAGPLAVSGIDRGFLFKWATHKLRWVNPTVDTLKTIELLRYSD